MRVDIELEAWRSQWQAETSVPMDLRARVQRQSRYMRWMLAADVVVTLGAGGFVTGWVLRSPVLDVMLLAVMVWSFIAAAWAFGIRNRRHLWSPTALTSAAYVDLSVRRCRGAIRAVSFGTILYFVEVFSLLGWIYQHRSREEAISPWAFVTSGAVLVVWLCTLAFLACMFWYGRRKLRELKFLQKLQTPL